MIAVPSSMPAVARPATGRAVSGSKPDPQGIHTVANPRAARVSTLLARLSMVDSDRRPSPTVIPMRTSRPPVYLDRIPAARPGRPAAGRPSPEGELVPVHVDGDGVPGLEVALQQQHGQVVADLA